MKSNAFNICPTCIYRDTCVLTAQKSQVWSCSEYDELAPETRVELAHLSAKEVQPELVMA